MKVYLVYDLDYLLGIYDSDSGAQAARADYIAEKDIPTEFHCQIFVRSAEVFKTC